VTSITVEYCSRCFYTEILDNGLDGATIFGDIIESSLGSTKNRVLSWFSLYDLLLSLND
jgi:hypothetical protein